MVIFDEIVHPDDILEEVELELAEDTFDEPFSCPDCNERMERIISTTTLREGQITIEFEQFRCPHCGLERMTLKQAQQLQTIKHFFINLSTESTAHKALVKPLTHSHFLVEVG